MHKSVTNNKLPNFDSLNIDTVADAIRLDWKTTDYVNCDGLYYYIEYRTDEHGVDYAWLAWPYDKDEGIILESSEGIIDCLVGFRIYKEGLL